MPPKLINQRVIHLPTTQINNNDGSAHSLKIEKTTNNLLSMIKPDILLISGGAIIIIYLMCKK